MLVSCRRAVRIAASNEQVERSAPEKPGVRAAQAASDSGFQTEAGAGMDGKDRFAPAAIGEING